uniref:Rubisco LSMT substrate-binding domain-containing protein n=1 Tax=Lotharella globosa TaxID=91324 RepID=A0A7S3YUB1_9EUKA|eukprot:CAMPEP_0167771400 /NCGR_PEP_ID=MMETSP0111_2-20121227/257_1 /TAXON_ID=91324 /ORGANISM="Lotharella globosa, Strain CCCM811" /LENGTH=246 /DNA_ID=CAMNT_0007660749 /DNA_START=54 /DNA_END=794 /DNA_ORIENTATION=-
MRDSVAVPVYIGLLCQKKILTLSRNGQKIPSPAFSALRMAAYFAQAPLVPVSGGKTKCPALSKYLRERPERKAGISATAGGKRRWRKVKNAPSSLSEVLQLPEKRLKDLRCRAISVANERFVLDMLRHSCKLALSKYPTSLEADKKTRNHLEQEPNSTRMMKEDPTNHLRHIFSLRVRMGEKRVLKWHVELCTLALRWIDKSIECLGDQRPQGVDDGSSRSLLQKSPAARAYLDCVLKPLLLASQR